MDGWEMVVVNTIPKMNERTNEWTGWVGKRLGFPSEQSRQQTDKLQQRILMVVTSDIAAV